ncbi:MAG: SU10 major capsid protein [Sciscionella sp.]
MASVAGQGTTYNLPNYHGELFTVSPTETPFLAAIGGLNAAKPVASTTFEWQTIDRRASSVNNAAEEGAAAPAGAERSRSNLTNVLEIHHSAIEVSYTKLAAQGNFAGANIAAESSDVVLNELTIQTMAELESMAVDIEQSFLSGTLNVPTDNTTARKTQGVLGVAGTVSDNAAAPGTPRAVSSDIVNVHLQKMFGAGAKLPQNTTVFLCGAGQKVALQDAYAQATLNAPTRDRSVGGVNIETLVTPFGTFGVMLDRWMPDGEIAVVDLSVCYPTFLNIPGKGLLFTEELARVGSSRKFQLYGEIGLEYGPTNAHGLITDLS